MKPKTKRTQRDYSLAFKLFVVDQVEKDEMTHKKAQHYQDIQSRSTVLVWLREHGRLDWYQRTGINAKAEISMIKPKDLTLEQKIKVFKQELADAKLKAQFFEVVVNLLDKGFGVYSQISSATRY